MSERSKGQQDAQIAKSGLGDEHITRAAAADIIFSSEHHTFVVTPWSAGPTAVRVTQLDDPECIVMLLRDKCEVLRLVEILLAVSEGTYIAGRAVGDVIPPSPGDNVPFWAEHAASIARVPGYSDAFVGSVLRSQLEIADSFAARGVVLPVPPETK